MAALVLTIALLVFFAVVGRALLTLLADGLDAVDQVLLSPAAGLAFVVVAVYTINRFGVPVGTFGPWFCIGGVATSLAVLVARRRALPLKELWPYGLVLLGALIVVARPMIELGFGWVANANPDLGYYVIAAQRVFRNGFEQLPSVNDMLTGREYSILAHTYGFAAGGDLILALVRSATRLRGDEAFMPVIVAFHLSMIASVGAMGRRAVGGNRAGVASAALLAVSPLAAYSILQQFLGQPIGLAFICALVALMFARDGTFPDVAGGRIWLAALLVAGLALTYPEILMLLAILLAAGAIVALVRRRFKVRKFLSFCGATFLLTVLVLNGYFPRAAIIVTAELLDRVAESPEHPLFPFFLTAKGFARVWGFRRFDDESSSFVLPILIILGAALLAGTVVWAVRSASRGFGAAVAFLTLAVLATVFYITRADFGLFRLAMYVQPFLIAAFVAGLVATRRARGVQVAAVVVIGALMLPTTLAYADQSRRSVNLPAAATGRLVDGFETAIAGKDRVVSGPDNLLLAQLEGQLAGKTRILFLSQDFFSLRFTTEEFALTSLDPTWAIFPELQKVRTRWFKAIRRAWTRHRFELGNGRRTSFLSNEVAESWLRSSDCSFATPGSAVSFLNRSRQGVSRTVAVERCDALRNELAFIASTAGLHFTFTESARNLAFYPQEPDYAFRGRSIAGAGRYMLIRVLSPSRRARMVVDITASPLSGDAKRLPGVSVLGAEEYRVPFVGGGSGRVLSQPVTPRVVDGKTYVVIDMGRTPTPIDFRRVSAFVRNISLVSEEEVARMRPPAQVNEIPADLGDSDLEYSGVYEDGWLGDRAFFVLGQPRGARQLVVNGDLPDLDTESPPSVDVLVDGRVVHTERLGSGRFVMRMRLDDWAPKRRVELKFSPTRLLPAPDGREVGALLKSIGFPAG